MSDDSELRLPRMHDAGVDDGGVPLITPLAQSLFTVQLSKRELFLQFQALKEQQPTEVPRLRAELMDRFKDDPEALQLYLYLLDAPPSEIQRL